MSEWRVSGKDARKIAAQMLATRDYHPLPDGSFGHVSANGLRFVILAEQDGVVVIPTMPPRRDWASCPIQEAVCVTEETRFDRKRRA